MSLNPGPQDSSLQTLAAPARLNLPLRFALGITGIVALTLAVFYALMQPPGRDIALMAGFLSITAVVSGIASYGAYRAGWMNQSPTIRWTLLAGYALSSALTFLNVWLTARLMFTSPHDLLLATVLLLFAGGIAMAIGFFLTSALTDRIQLLDQATRALSTGNLDARAWVEGQDEIATLAQTFNQMAAQLQEADRKKRDVESLRRDLIAWVSHDLQTPLASIRAIVEALADGMVEDPEIEQRYLRTVQREVASLSLLIDDLFQMAQLDAGGLVLNREPCSLSDLISDTLESFSALANQQGVLLQGSVAPGVDPVTLDGRLIGRVLNNLVANGLRHTNAGGRVDVHARRVPAGIHVEVLDTGEGIQPEDFPYVFDRFYRGEKSRSRSTGGAGLGLAIARGIVEAHGGKISLESQAGEHTRFYFVLPAQPA